MKAQGGQRWQKWAKPPNPFIIFEHANVWKKKGRKIRGLIPATPSAMALTTKSIFNIQYSMSCHLSLHLLLMQWQSILPLILVSLLCCTWEVIWWSSLATQCHRKPFLHQQRRSYPYCTGKLKPLSRAPDRITTQKMKIFKEQWAGMGVGGTVFQSGSRQGWHGAGWCGMAEPARSPWSTSNRLPGYFPFQSRPSF